MEDWRHPDDGISMDDWRPGDDAEWDDPPASDDYEVVALFEGPAQEAQACTLVPRDAGEAELMTRWLSADAGSFVSLEEIR